MSYEVTRCDMNFFIGLAFGFVLFWLRSLEDE
jgi:hypothetical protein